MGTLSKQQESNEYTQSMVIVCLNLESSGSLLHGKRQWAYPMKRVQDSVLLLNILKFLQEVATVWNNKAYRASFLLSFH